MMMNKKKSLSQILMTKQKLLLKGQKRNILKEMALYKKELQTKLSQKKIYNHLSLIKNIKLIVQLRIICNLTGMKQLMIL